MRYPDEAFLYDIVEPEKEGYTLVRSCLYTLQALVDRAKALGKSMVIVIDNGNPHHANKVKGFVKRNKEWVRVIWLPRYCPQLNLIERFWKSIKERYFSNFLCKAPEDLVGRVEFVFKTIGYPCRSPAKRKTNGFVIALRDPCRSLSRPA